MGFFSRRRKRESAIPDSTGETPLGSFASPEGQPVVGNQVGGGAPDLASMGVADGLAALTQIGPMIQQAIASGNVQISQGEPQVLDMRGSGLREEILEIMGQHGIDPQKGVVDGSADPNSYAEMQQQIMAALAKHGIDTGAGGATINVQPDQVPPGWEGGESK